MTTTNLFPQNPDEEIAEPTLSDAEVTSLISVLNESGNTFLLQCFENKDLDAIKAHMERTSSTAGNFVLAEKVYQALWGDPFSACQNEEL